MVRKYYLGILNINGKWYGYSADFRKEIFIGDTYDKQQAEATLRDEVDRLGRIFPRVVRSEHQGYLPTIMATKKFAREQMVPTNNIVGVIAIEIEEDT